MAGSHTVPVVVALSVQICTTGPRLGLKVPAKDGCATIGGRKKKFGFPPPWAPSRISAEMWGGCGEVSDCWSRQPNAMARARHGATARFSMCPPGRLCRGSRKNNALRGLAAEARLACRCKCGATTVSPPRTALVSHQRLEPWVIFQVAPPPADVLAAFEMAWVGGRVALQQGNCHVAVAEQRLLHRLDREQLLAGVRGWRRGGACSLQHTARAVLQPGPRDDATSAEPRFEPDVRPVLRGSHAVEQGHETPRTIHVGRARRRRHQQQLTLRGSVIQREPGGCLVAPAFRLGELLEVDRAGEQA